MTTAKSGLTPSAQALGAEASLGHRGLAEKSNVDQSQSSLEQSASFFRYGRIFDKYPQKID